MLESAVASEVLRFVLVTVLALAGLGKSLDQPNARSLVIGSTELVMAVALATGVLRVVFAVLAVAMTLAFLVHALAAPRDARCACFGSRLPTIGRAGQRVRNTVLSTVAAVYLLLMNFPVPSESGALQLAARVLGIGLGLSLVFVPWLIDYEGAPA
jgi:hypothetical protein